MIIFRNHMKEILKIFSIVEMITPRFILIFSLLLQIIASNSCLYQLRKEDSLIEFKGQMHLP